MSKLSDELGRRGVHPARVVVLVPYAQLMPVARAAWAREVPDGFAPRFETTRNWAGANGFAPQPDDISFDRGRDLLTARLWLERAGLEKHAEPLAARLVDAAVQLGAVVAAVPPPGRPAWLREARLAAALGSEAPALALEAAVARIAVEWAAASNYATDPLLAQDLGATLDLLVLLQGFQSEPLADAIGHLLPGRCLTLSLDRPAPWGEIRLHEADDPSHEAEMTGACVMRHLEAGRTPVALAAVDRVLTRRVRAMLEARGVAMRDETGWKLSTTRSAASVLAALRGCVWDAGSDAVLDWLKNMPAASARSVSALERRVRREGWREWRTARARGEGGEAAGWELLIAQANAWRETMAQPRALPQWLQALRELLQATGQWPGLARDAAGLQLLEVLGLDVQAQARWQQLPQAGRRLGPAEFSAWVKEALEAASFQPAHPEQAQVVILPLHQLLARPFAALVLAGCDEQRLTPSPEPPGAWSAAQRELLGLPSRAALEAELRAGWRSALQTPHCDLLWRRSDEAGEPVLASALVQVLRLDGVARPGADARVLRQLVAAPVARPLPVAADLRVETLSASAYEDLRHCPYRFYALRQLGLQEAAEIEGELGKRDFGSWLHKVLSRFHEQARDAGLALDAAQLDRVAVQVTREMGLDEAEFLPFSSAWPATRDGYLQWLATHAAREGAVFESAESEHALQLGPVKLVGRIDRVDRLPDGRLFVMDYKTEARSFTLERVRQPAEDTQLAFYAALLADDTLRAGYVNVGEREGTKLVEQHEIVPARDLLVEGILHDLQQLGEGAALPALGEGRVCGFCAARGVCRRDFWE